MSRTASSSHHVLQVFIDITDLYCLATTVIATPTHSPYQFFRHTHAILCQDMASDQRYIYDLPAHIPTPRFPFPILLFFLFNLFRLFHSSVVALAIVESGSSLGFVCQHELVMMALQHPSAEDGMNWCSEGGLITNDSCSSDTEHLGFFPSSS